MKRNTRTSYYFIPLMVFGGGKEHNVLFPSLEDFQNSFPPQDHFKVTSDRLMHMSDLVIREGKIIKNRWVYPDGKTKVTSNTILTTLIGMYDGAVVRHIE